MSIRNWNASMGRRHLIKLLNRVSKQIERRGVLEVLRNGD